MNYSEETAFLEKDKTTAIQVQKLQGLLQYVAANSPF